MLSLLCAAQTQMDWLQVIGSHQLSPEAKEKATKRRAKQAAEHHKVTASEREQAQQLKKQERKQEELVRFTSAISVRLECMVLVALLPCSRTACRV